MKTCIKKYMVLAIAVCIGCTAVLLGGCKNLTESPKTEASKSAEKYLISFAFKQAYNPWLKNDIIGTIDQELGVVRITVPESAYEDPSNTAAKKKFKASFTVGPKAKLYKGTAEQKSDSMEDLFVENKEYRVVAEDGSSKTYTVRIKIDYATPAVDTTDAETIKQFYGAYSGKLHFDYNYYDICVVYDQEKLISYSGPMSAIYANVQWEKVSETEWICKTYSKNDFKRKKVKNTVTFKVGADGKPTCQIVVNAMGNASSNDMKKGPDYNWAPDDGKGFKAPGEP